MPAKPQRNGIFISYSRADKNCLERVKVHLKPIEREHNVIVWNDTKLRSGEKWRPAISKALASAKVAILLVSADFLASDFVITNELPALLRAAGKEGLIILPVIVSRCSFSFSPLNQYQTVNDPGNPLDSMVGGQAEEVFYKLFERVYEIFVPATSPRTTDKRTAGKTQKTRKPASVKVPAKPALAKRVSAKTVLAKAAPAKPVAKKADVPSQSTAKKVKTTKATTVLSQQTVSRKR
jgi:hypothetical protein